MITRGSKFFYGAAAFGFVAAFFYGFISNAAAIAVAHARHAREVALQARTDLSPDERDALFDDYVRRTARWIKPVAPMSETD